MYSFVNINLKENEWIGFDKFKGRVFVFIFKKFEDENGCDWNEIYENLRVI